jgi:Ca2+-binding EF-hand superfamily protein
VRKRRRRRARRGGGAPLTEPALQNSGDEAGLRPAFAPDSFPTRYRVVEAAAASPECSLTWWPPTDEMLAIIERSYRATLGVKDDSGFNLSFASSFKLPASTALGGAPQPASPPGAESASSPGSHGSLPDTANSPSNRSTRIPGEPPPGSLTMELVSEMYLFLVRHQTEQTQRFDSVIKTREENRIAEEAAERERQEEAERARLEKEQKEQEELETLLKKGGKGARARIAQIRGLQANATESGRSELEQATEVRKMSTLCAKAWRGGHLTRTNLERAFRALPERPSGAQARYLYEKRARYCDETKGQNFLTAEGFTRLVHDLGHLQADLASQKTKRLEKIFKKLDTRRKGEITMAQILGQIETEEQNLLMPLVDALMKTSDTNHNGLLDIREFPAFYFGWMELHRMFEVNDDCRIEEKWIDLETLDGDLLQFVEIELLSSVFQGIKSKVSTSQHQVAQMRPVISSLGEMKLIFVPGTRFPGGS